MARSKEKLTSSIRLSDSIALGVLEQIYPKNELIEILKSHNQHSIRKRRLPNEMVFALIIASYLYFGVSQNEVLRLFYRVFNNLASKLADIATKSAITKARNRLTHDPLKTLFTRKCVPSAPASLSNAWYKGLRLVSIDGSSLNIADSKTNRTYFSGPTSGKYDGAFPQLRFIAACEIGTRIIFSASQAPYTTSENHLLLDIIDDLKSDMLVLADRNFYSYELWTIMKKKNINALFRVSKSLKLSVHQKLSDGSYISLVLPTPKVRRKLKLKKGDKIKLRVFTYKTVKKGGKSSDIFRIVTNLYDDKMYPAEELMNLYPKRWEVETAFDEIKTHLKMPRQLLRSKSPELVKQDFYGLLLAHFLIRITMLEAALKGTNDPLKLSFVHSREVIKTQAVLMMAFPPERA